LAVTLGSAPAFAFPPLFLRCIAPVWGRGARDATRCMARWPVALIENHYEYRATPQHFIDRQYHPASSTSLVRHLSPSRTQAKPGTKPNMPIEGGTSSLQPLKRVETGVYVAQGARHPAGTTSACAGCMRLAPAALDSRRGP